VHSAGSAQSSSSAETSQQLDYDAVQRGDAEMENRMNRLVRACAELGERNPIVSIHDQVRCSPLIASRTACKYCSLRFGGFNCPCRRSDKPVLSSVYCHLTSAMLHREQAATVTC
jgi:hypothetical protein